MHEPRFIAIEGSIGAGKTTLAHRLAKQYDARLVLEVDEDNPFMDKFYEDRSTYAFQTQVFFLLNRYNQYLGPRPEGFVQQCGDIRLPVPSGPDLRGTES